MWDLLCIWLHKFCRGIKAKLIFFLIKKILFLKRKPYGTKCDVWSLGIIFHEMLFHDVPWKARDERELLHNILNVPFTIRNSSVSKLS